MDDTQAAAAAAPVVWTDAQVKLFICYLTDDGLPSDSFFELRKEDIRAGIEAASRLGAAETPTNVRERILEAARMFDALPEADRENLKSQIAWLSGNQRKED